MNERIRDIKIENLIWITYFFITIAALTSNFFEIDFIKTRKIKDYKYYKNINISIFTVAFFIYLYFVYFNYKNVTNLKKNASRKKVLFTNINFIASLLFLIGGIIYLYTESNSNDLDNGNIAI